jgi:mRNA interferase MazF
VVSRPPQRDEVWLVTLGPTRGMEIQKTRPCLVISPDEMNQHLQTVSIETLSAANSTRTGFRPTYSSTFVVS